MSVEQYVQFEFENRDEELRKALDLLSDNSGNGPSFRRSIGPYLRHLDIEKYVMEVLVLIPEDGVTARHTWEGDAIGVRYLKRGCKVIRQKGVIVWSDDPESQWYDRL